jgi:hypothetical protein
MLAVSVNFRSVPAIVRAGNLIANAKFQLLQQQPNPDDNDNSWKRKDMVACPRKFPFLIDPTAYLRTIGPTSTGSGSSSSSSSSSSIAANQSFQDSLPFGLVTVTECVCKVNEDAQHEYVKYLIQNLIVGQEAENSPTGREAVGAELSLERIRGSEFAILFRHNRSGRSLQRFLKSALPKLRMKWKNSRKTGISYALPHVGEFKV